MYEYIETDSIEEKPEGVGWEYWGQLITPKIEKAVWRRKKQYSTNARL